jgi:hypothetical protein
MSTKSKSKSRRNRRILVKTIGEMVMRYAYAGADSENQCRDGICSLDPDFAARRKKLMEVAQAGQTMPTTARCPES